MSPRDSRNAVTEDRAARLRRAAAGISILIAMGMPARAWWIQTFPSPGANGDSLWRDTSGPGSPHVPRLAIGNGAYLANGKTFLVWESFNGDFWGSPTRRFTPSPDRQKYPFQPPAPLAIDVDRKTNAVLWGNWLSPDQGRTWNPLPFPSSRFRAYGMQSGTCLGGGAGETIERSSDSGRTWVTVHQGAGTGFIQEFVFPDAGLFREAGWVFAIAYPAKVLFSRNRGQTWKEWPIADSLGLSGTRIHGIAYSIGMGISGGPPPTRYLWTLHLDSVTGRSRLVRHFLDSAREELFTQGLPDTLTCLSSGSGRVFTGGGRDLYLIDNNGTVRRPLTLDHLPEGEVLQELHGDGSDFGSFALTRKLYFTSYYESLEAPRSIRSGPQGAVRLPFGRFLLPAGSGSALSFLIDGRSLPLSR